MEAEAREIVRESLEFAENSEAPPASYLYTDVLV